MELTSQAAAEIARQYFGADPIDQLGWGISGYVYLSPDRRTAVKVHRHEESFRQELSAYKMLHKIGIVELHGLNVPKLRSFNRQLRVIEMDFVIPPFLLDFAGVKFSPPDFSEDVMAHWHAKLEEFFGPNVSVAYDVYHSLAKHGIYYMDFRPSNMKLDGLPGLLPHDLADDS